MMKRDSDGEHRTREAVGAFSTIAHVSRSRHVIGAYTSPDLPRLFFLGHYAANKQRALQEHFPAGSSRYCHVVREWFARAGPATPLRRVLQPTACCVLASSSVEDDLIERA